MGSFQDKVGFIWSVADLLRGPNRPAAYGKVILPLTVLRRLDCVLAPTRDAVWKKLEKLKKTKLKDYEPVLNKVTGHAFQNITRLDFEKLKGEPDKIADNLRGYIKGFSRKAREIIEYFKFDDHITTLAEHDRLYLVVKKFCEIDLHPDAVPNHERRNSCDVSHQNAVGRF
jgi:type I restriction enzyme M protein